MPPFVALSDDGLGNISKWKESLLERTASRQNINLMQLVYGNPASASTTYIDNDQDGSEDEEGDGDEFFKPKGEWSKVNPLVTWIYSSCFMIVLWRFLLSVISFPELFLLLTVEIWRRIKR